MTYKDFKLLDFILEKGFDPINGCMGRPGVKEDVESTVCVKIANELTDYDLKYIHCKIFKMPVQMFTPLEVQRAVMDRLHKECIEFISEKNKEYEIVSDKEYKKIKAEQTRNKLLIVYCILIVILVGLMIYCYYDGIEQIKHINEILYY